jgi:zinc transporter ZupT
MTLNPAIAVGLAYAGGFVVVNALTARFHPVDYQLLRSQYFAAAVLLSILTGIPAMLGFIIGRDLRRDEVVVWLRRFGPVWRTFLRVGLFLLGVLSSIFFAWLIQGLLVQAAFGEGRYHYVAYFAGVLSFTCLITYISHPNHPWQAWKQATAAA